MKRYLLIALVSAGFAGTANAQDPADIEAVLNNLGPTIETATDGLSDTAEVLLATQSAVQTSAALGGTLVDATSTLVNGSPTLGAFSLAALIVNGSTQDLLNPALTAIDDPTAANIEAALSPNDLNTILVNLETTPGALLEGSGESSFAPNGNGLRAAGIDLLQGNIGDLSGGLLINGSGGVVFAVQELTADTNYQPLGNVAAIGALALLLGGEPLFAELRDPAAQLGAAGAPLTDPIVDILADSGF